MNITVAEVIEECAQAIEPKNSRPCDCKSACDCYEQCGWIKVSAVEEWDTKADCASAIRALKQQYEGCIVAESEAIGHACRVEGSSVDCSIKPMMLPADGNHVQLYLALETR